MSIESPTKAPRTLHDHAARVERYEADLAAWQADMKAAGRSDIEIFLAQPKFDAGAAPPALRHDRPAGRMDRAGVGGAGDRAWP